MRALFPIKDAKISTLDWMTEHKTESALLIVESSFAIIYPDYVAQAIEFVE